MKTVTVAIALVLLNVLLIVPDAVGNRGPVRPGPIMKPQQASLFVHPEPMRPHRAVPQGHFRQLGPQQAGRMAAARPRYARGDTSAVVITFIGTTGDNLGGVIEPGATRETDALTEALQAGSNLGTELADKQRVAGQKAIHASSNTAAATADGLAAFTGGTKEKSGARRRRNKVNL